MLLDQALEQLGGRNMRTEFTALFRRFWVFSARFLSMRRQCETRRISFRHTDSSSSMWSVSAQCFSFSESKEAIAGFFIIQADSLEEAVQIAKNCPSLDNGQTVEVRAIASEAAELQVARQKLAG